MAETIIALYPYILGGVALIWVWSFFKGLLNK